MGGGGGSQPVSSMPTMAEGTWNVAVIGVESTYDTWEDQFGWVTTHTTTYDTNPSITRWLVEAGITAAGGNPYEGVSAYEPSAKLSEVDTRLSNLADQVTSLGIAAGFGSYADDGEGTLPAEITAESLDTLRKRLITEADSSGTTIVQDAAEAAYQATLEGVIGDATTAFQTRAATRAEKSQADFEVRLADIGGANSSAFAFGLASMFIDLDERVDQFDKDRALALSERAFQGYLDVFLNEVKVGLVSHLEERRLHSVHTLEATKTLLAALSSETEHYVQLTAETRGGSAMAISAYNDEYQADLEIDVREATWDPEQITRIGHLVSNWSGSIVPMERGPSRLQSSISGAMGGAALGARAGAMIGSAGGPIGAGGGALIGGIGGLLAGSL